jgi:phytoene dehydrogenase-like protein
MTSITRREFVKAGAAVPLALSTFTSIARATGLAERFDVVVAGAGHNSLLCAAYLAKAGYKLVVLEGQAIIGGGVKTAEVCHPGFKDDLFSTAHVGFSQNPVMRNDELQLRDYGYGEYIESDPVMHIPFIDGASITIWRDLDRTCETIARISRKDANTYRKMVAEYKAYTAATREAPEAKAGNAPRIPMVGLWKRRYAMSGYQLTSDLFESDYMRRASLMCGHLGSVPPSDSDTGGQAYSLVNFHLTGRVIPKGGSGTLTVALGRYIEAHGGVVLTNKRVTELIIEGNRCAGVRCADGDTFRAEKAVVSTVHVKHLVDMAPSALWGEEFLQGVELFQPEHAMISFHYATTEAPQYPLPNGATISTGEAVICPRLEKYLLLNYENSTGELDLDDPPGLQIVSPSVVDPTRAPAGCHTVKIETNLPYNLKQGPEHWDAIKDQVADSLLNHFRKFAPNLTPDKIIGKFIQSPLDIERMNAGMWRGSAHAGASNSAQNGPMRPVPGWSEYRMPIPGLFQTGACTPPGGSVTGVPGRNAAAVILKEFGTSLEEVVKKG